MARNSVSIDIDLNDRNAQRKLKELARSAGDTEDAFDDAESAGKAMARAIEQSADDMIAEIDATARAVDALDRALGDDLDTDTREVVADLKRLGLTAEDVEADAEQLAAALRRTDDVKLHAAERGFSDVGQAVGSVRDDTERARDSMHGFIGGTVGELPLISEAMGPVGEGLGQLTEGALEGQIGFRQLLGAGLAMGGIALVMDRVNKKLEKAAQVEAFKQENVDDYTDALLDADTALEGIVEKLQEGVEINLLGDALDVTAAVNQMGLGIEDFARLVEGGQTQIDAWEQAMRDAGITGDALDATVLALNSELDAYEQGADAAAATQQFLGETQAEGVDVADELAAATDRAVAAQEEAEAQADEVATAYGELADRATEAAEAQGLMAETAYDLEEAQWAVEDAVTELDQVMSDKEATDRDVRAAQIAVAQAAQTAADAEVNLARRTAQAEGATLSATQALDIENGALLRQASTLNGASRKAVLEHIARVNGIPPEKMTEINAAIDRGDIPAAESALNQVSRTRHSTVNAGAYTRDAENALNYTARDRNATIYLGTINTGGGRFAVPLARGTKHHRGGTALVGEEGPELAELPRGTKVTPAARTKMLLQQQQGQGSSAPISAPNVTVIQHFPAGALPADVMAARRRYEHRNGPT